MNDNTLEAAARAVSLAVGNPPRNAGDPFAWYFHPDFDDPANIFEHQTREKMRDIVRAVLPHVETPPAVDPVHLEDLSYWVMGTALIENSLALAEFPDPDNIPISFDPALAPIWHAARAQAFRHALEMMGVPKQSWGRLHAIAKLNGDRAQA